ncbi:MAG: Hsp20/alpha crystallin family protein [Bacteroidetes bacterium]|nr:Hsp20/alpha crystallin family protein [Bacteroidota bacterium]
MTVVRWNPVNEMMNLQREMNRFFNGMPTRRERDEDYESAVWSPMTDITEDSDKYELRFDLPGMSKEDIKMNFSENTLKISGERHAMEEKKEETCHRVERVSGKFFRSFNFPTQVDSNKISASYKDGVLTVTVPKTEEVKPRHIAIQ